MGGRRRGGKKGGASPGARAREGADSSSHGEEQKLLALDIHSILKAIESLYVDQLKPFGRILRKRVAEHAVEKVGGDLTAYSDLPEVDIAELRALCEKCPLLCVRPEEGGDWSAVFVDRHPAFMDVYCPLDIYPPEMWQEAGIYFAKSEHDMTLPGGRYSCAQALMARKLPFLQGRSLGQVCHIVQLCISQKKLLGYLNGAVVPYGRSQSMVKEQCAVYQQPCATHPTHHGMPGLQMATWEAAAACLQEILSSAATNGAPGMVPLSNMKRLFRSRYHLELSETSLGHSKLSELLQDFRLKDVCTVQLHGHGYMVVQVQPYMVQPQRPPQGQTITLADKLFPAEATPYTSPPPQHAEPMICEALSEAKPRGFCLDEPLGFEEAGIFVDHAHMPATELPKWPSLSPSTLSKNGVLGQIVQNTFIHTNPAPPTPLATQRRRSQSLPKDMGSHKSLWEATCHALSFKKPEEDQLLPKEPVEDRIVEGSGSFSTADSPAPGSRTASSPSSPDGSAGESASTASRVPGLVQERPSVAAQYAWPETPLWPPTPAPAKTWASSFTVGAPLPAAPGLEPARVSIGSGTGFQVGSTIEPLAAWDMNSAPYDNSSYAIKPFPVEPLVFDTTPSAAPRRLEFCPDEPLCLEDAGVFTQSFFPKPSPKGLSGMVHNTFIHAAAPPPTPPVGSHWRSRSVPKNAGSKQQANADGNREPVGSPLARAYGGGRFSAVRSPAGSPNATRSPAFLARVPPSPALTASPVYCGPKSYPSDAPQRVLHLSQMI
mmetsp:Transcript_30103/g.54913  ORF Transcript_30103/g.54913 Transcript_30103/m.54913 type:complete len:773 (+) Transcript_30103:115-2433(+)